MLLLHPSTSRCFPPPAMARGPKGAPNAIRCPPASSPSSARRPPPCPVTPVQTYSATLLRAARPRSEATLLFAAPSRPRREPARQRRLRGCVSLSESACSFRRRRCSSDGATATDRPARAPWAGFVLRLLAVQPDWACTRCTGPRVAVRPGSLRGRSLCGRRPGPGQANPALVCPQRWYRSLPVAVLSSLSLSLPGRLAGPCGWAR
jgi:hypothetical protein